MAVIKRGPNLARITREATKTDFNSAINSSPVETRLSARDCQAL